MPEQLRPQRNADRSKQDAASEQQRFVETPEYKERRETTYKNAQALIERLHTMREGKQVPEGITFSKIEKSESREENDKAALELYEFFGTHFDQDTNEDEMQRRIAIENGFANFDIARGPDGKIVSCLQSFNMALPNDTREPEGEGLGIWYSATDKEYRSNDLALSLYTQAIEHTLAQAQAKGVPFQGFFGETDPNMEDFVNERFDRKRMYYENGKGEIVEAPYLALPEDESGIGVRQNLMYRSFDGATTMSGEQLATINERIHAGYTRSEYFTGEYAEFSEKRYGMPAASAEQHHRNYVRVARGIDSQFRTQVSGQAIMMLSRAEREGWRGRGRRIRENIDQ